MANKLVVVTNSLTVPKIKKILLYEMKFLVPNYSCLQNPWPGGYRPQIPVLCPLSSTEFVEPPPLNKIPGYATDIYIYISFLVTEREEPRIPEITTRHCSDWSVSNLQSFSLHSRRISKFIRISAKPEPDHVYRALIRSHTISPPVLHRKKVFMYILT